MGAEPKKILVIQTAFLGDVVLTTPLLEAVRATFPRCYLTVLVIPETKAILENHPAIDEILVIEKKGSDRGLKGLFRISHGLRESQFDCVLLPHRSFRSALLAWLAAIPVRIGYWQTIGAVLYTKRVWRYRSQHEVDRCLALHYPLTIRPLKSVPHPSLSVTSEERETIWKRLTALGVQSGDCIVGLSPGSVWATKRWTEEGFAAVADHFAIKKGVKVILLGSRDDSEVVSRILKRCRYPMLDLTGQTSLRQLSVVLTYCKVLLTNDNGAMHVAEAAGTPIVAVFGSTTLDLGYGPRNPQSMVVEHPLYCRPCGPHGYQHCPQGHFRCMKEIAADEVIKAVEKQLTLR